MLLDRPQLVNRARADPSDLRTLKALVSRNEFYATVRDHADGHDLAGVPAQRFSVDRTVVLAALTGSALPATSRRAATKSNPSLSHLQPHIDRLITDQPTITITAIWQQLVDQHNTDVCYHTVRDYIAREQRKPAARQRRKR